mmetsp:Transcript_26065/g.28822  ORF Transcript_26065/g.28822 Transcript_26065/m.28822 type:complete len:164 (-) Transcript_26065:259-750(-)
MLMSNLNIIWFIAILATQYSPFLVNAQNNETKAPTSNASPSTTMSNEVPLECQNLARDMQTCISSNADCYITPKCMEIIRENGNPPLGEFSCDQSAHFCSYVTCCENCAEVSKDYTNCAADAFGCSEICEAPTSNASLSTTMSYAVMVALLLFAGVQACSASA